MANGIRKGIPSRVVASALEQTSSLKPPPARGGGGHVTEMSCLIKCNRSFLTYGFFEGIVQPAVVDDVRDGHGRILQVLKRIH